MAETAERRKLRRGCEFRELKKSLTQDPEFRRSPASGTTGGFFLLKKMEMVLLGPDNFCSVGNFTRDGCTLILRCRRSRALDFRQRTVSKRQKIINHASFVGSWELEYAPRGSPDANHVLLLESGLVSFKLLGTILSI